MDNNNQDTTHISETTTHAGVGVRSLFVVGDDAQTIYGFRGSKVDIILNFEDQYPMTKEIILNQNYRSTQKILDLAEKVLTHNPHQKKKELFTHNPEDREVRYYLARNERDEAEYIVRQVVELYQQEARVVDQGNSGDSGNRSTSSDDLSREADVDNQIINMFDATDNADNASEDDEDGDYHIDTTEEGSMLSFGGRDVYPTSSQHNSDTIGSESVTHSVSSMFDVYLDMSESSAKTPYTNYSTGSWSIPQVKWSRVASLNSVVVLYRTHSQSRAIEEAFLKHHIPYKLVSGTRFLDRREIKDVLAMLRYLSNGDDKISLGRFIPLVLDGVGPKTLQKITAYLDDFSYPLAPKYQQLVVSLISSFQSVWSKNTSLIDLTKELLEVSGYLTYLKSQYSVKEEYEARLENIGELYSLMFQFDERADLPLKERLTQFLIHVALMSAVDNSEQDDVPKISLMSLHQSKGLEFETVFLVGVEDGLLPHQNSFYEEGGMEEEVRLAYVGVTRAKKNLFLISADSRVQFGQIKANPVSRIFRPFLDTHIKRSR